MSQVAAAAEVEASGFAVVEGALDARDLARLDAVIERRIADRAGRRNLLDDPAIAEFAAGLDMLRLVEPVLGRGAFPVRALLFDKTSASNWRVAFHQDLAIAVRERHDVPGFSGWSLKAGVPHVQASAGVLQRMLAVRVHLDDCGERDGPLRVLPGSHGTGHIAETEIAAWRAKIAEATCVVARGGLILIRPLLLHASSPSASGHRRRVIHVEYATDPLPHGLEWHWPR